MHVSSLGFRTDLALLTASGSLVEGRGTHFDPDLVDAFVEVADAFEQIAQRYADAEPDESGVAD